MLPGSAGALGTTTGLGERVVCLQDGNNAQAALPRVWGPAPQRQRAIGRAHRYLKLRNGHTVSCHKSPINGWDGKFEGCTTLTSCTSPCQISYTWGGWWSNPRSEKAPSVEATQVRRRHGHNLSRSKSVSPCGLESHRDPCNPKWAHAYQILSNILSNLLSPWAEVLIPLLPRVFLEIQSPCPHVAGSAVERHLKPPATQAQSHRSHFEKAQEAQGVSNVTLSILTKISPHLNHKKRLTETPMACLENKGHCSHVVDLGLEAHLNVLPTSGHIGVLGRSAMLKGGPWPVGFWKCLELFSLWLDCFCLLTYTNSGCLCKILQSWFLHNATRIICNLLVLNFRMKLAQMANYTIIPSKHI